MRPARVFVFTRTTKRGPWRRTFSCALSMVAYVNEWARLMGNPPLLWVSPYEVRSAT
jgi:hypothetical protein